MTEKGNSQDYHLEQATLALQSAFQKLNEAWFHLDMKNCNGEVTLQMDRISKLGEEVSKEVEILKMDKFDEGDELEMEWNYGKRHKVSKLRK